MVQTTIGIWPKLKSQSKVSREKRMPLYEYECKDCNHQVEVLVPRPDSKATCPDCGSKKLSKLLSVIGSPVISGGVRSRSVDVEPGNCGRSQCASGGCMFGNE
jgi:putative FmdB family regulatory protein